MSNEGHSVYLLPVSTWCAPFVAAIRRHYTGSRGAPPGRKLAWRIMVGARSVGWVGVGEPAYKLAARRRLGLLDARPLPATVCCFIYRREDPTGPSGAAILDLYHRAAAIEWLRRWEESIVHWETLVLPGATPSPVAGACFRSAGYRSLGMTTGRSARRPAGSTRGARVWGNSEPKLVLYRGPLPRVALVPA